VQGRGGRGVVTAKIVEARGELVGALMVHAGDEIFAITSAGGVIRTSADEVKRSGRQTMGVRLMNLAAGDSVVGLALNAESIAEAEAEAADAADPADLDLASPDLASPDLASPDLAGEEEGEAE
jgi:DNA gyrase subunit A